jgi:hypothetical protein
MAQDEQTMYRAMVSPPRLSRSMTPFARAGSQRWLQVAIDRHPAALNRPISQILGVAEDTISWRSPLRSEGFCEYRDMEALRCLDVTRLPQRSLSAFWPRRGPVWDALGRTERGDLLFVEAKAHIAEAASSPTHASTASLPLIQKSRLEVRRFLAPNSEADWTRSFYQYANRLAHLYLFRRLNDLPAHLVLVYFLNARDVGGPTSVAEWRAAIALLQAALGLKSHSLESFIHTVFVDIAPFAEVDE